MVQTATRKDVGTAGEPAATYAAAPPAGPLKRWLSLGMRVAVVVAIAAGMTWSVVDQWPQVRSTWLGLAWQSVVLSVLAALAGMVANTMAWRAAVRDLEHRVSVSAALRICLVGQLGKYIPGSVWAYVLQVELSRRAGLPRARAFLATLVSVGLGVTAALGLGLLSLPALRDAAGGGDSTYAGSVRVALWIVAALFPVALVCAVPRVLTALVQFALRVLRRPPLEHRLTWPGVSRVVGWSALGYALFGVHLWLLANAQATPGMEGLLRSVGSFAIAMTVGMFAFLSPSGLGVREAVLVAALAPFLVGSGGVGAAMGIALASRLIFTIADVLAAGLAALSGVRQLRRDAPAQAATAGE
ncbi:flippase-like domain-containing protein [Micromonospora sp. KC207]|uniref:lysylphosphatidylglycerol synthase transmembrane domain-containing protein n=1 Tax=Micromonospora sp. KC207 TaxID=2530377 RepID=UPI001049D2D4|nr:lysylphosphatidylglycerol synthase transmembrane domain-containing protein [Micromonospora sp. KC207]TDC64624.1 flippase-like domain-containing protein [Micromonospora sp. KC207]